MGAVAGKNSAEGQGSSSPDTDGHVLELESIITAISHLPPREDTDLAEVRERQREKEVIRRRVAALVEDSDVVRAV